MSYVYRSCIHSVGKLFRGRNMHCSPPYSERGDDYDSWYLSEVTINNGLLAVNDMDAYDFFHDHHQLATPPSSVYTPPSPSSSVSRDGSVSHTDSEGERYHACTPCFCVPRVDSSASRLYSLSELWTRLSWNSTTPTQTPTSSRGCRCRRRGIPALPNEFH